MSRLSLRVHAPELPEGAVLAAELVDARRNTVTTMPMPVGETTEVTVDPGHYLLQVSLPSGQLLDAEFVISEADEDALIELRSPTRRGTRPRRRPGGQSAPTPSVTELADLEAWDPELPRSTDAPGAGLEPPFSDEAPMLADRLAPPFYWEDPVVVDGPAARRPRRSLGPRAAVAGVWARLWTRSHGSWEPARWRGSSIRRHGPEVQYSLRLLRGRLHMLQLGGPNLPWRLVSLPPTSNVDVVVKPAHQAKGRAGRSQFDAGIVLTVTSRDGQAEALLGYLVAGRLDAATIVGKPLLDDAEDLLFRKSQNPMGAAVGGYYLLQLRAEDRLHDWPNNFANWMRWLPDAAVIHAAQLLGQRSIPRALVRDRLLQAVWAGVPVYSEGLRLLYDALQLFAADRRGADGPIQQALERIRPYAIAVDWGKPLTSFWGATPAAPSLKRLTGRPRGRPLGIRTLEP